MEWGTVVVSPHFDDAVLSCWSILNRLRDDACVLTVFAGAPLRGRLWSWDAKAPGSKDSATRVAQRAAENRKALALTASQHVELDLREIQYADVGGGRLDLDDLRPYVAHASTVYAPAADGPVVHPDHATVRRVVQEIRPDASLYADQPYFRFPLHLELAGERAGFTRDVVVLGDEEARAKAAAISCYAGEVIRLEALEQRLRSPEREFRYEVIWTPVPGDSAFTTSV